MLAWELKPKDYTRLQTLGQNTREAGTILLKLESTQQTVIEKTQRALDDESMYDCLSLYKHPDKSQEWRRCKVVRRKTKDDYRDIKNATFDSQCFEYWIEFLHLRENEGQKQMWFKRKSEEILFSGTYTRLIQRSFKQEIRDYIKTTYKGIKPE